MLPATQSGRRRRNDAIETVLTEHKEATAEAHERHSAAVDAARKGFTELVDNAIRNLRRDTRLAGQEMNKRMAEIEGKDWDADEADAQAA